MSQIAYKPQALAAELASRLLQRGFAPKQTSDVDGYPLVSVGPGTAGGQNAVIKVMSAAAPLAKDALGNVANIYTPDVMMIALEAGAVGASLLDATHLLQIMADATEFHTRVELWNSANGTAPSAATFATAANFKAAWDSIKYPLLSTM